MSHLRVFAPTSVNHAVEEAKTAAATQLRYRAPLNTSPAQIRTTTSLVLETILEEVTEKIETPIPHTASLVTSDHKESPTTPRVEVVHSETPVDEEEIPEETETAVDEKEIPEEIETEPDTPVTPLVYEDEEYETPEEIETGPDSRPSTPVIIEPDTEEKESKESSIDLQEVRSNRTIIINALSYSLHYLCKENTIYHKGEDKEEDKGNDIRIEAKDFNYQLDPEFYFERTTVPNLTNLLNHLAWSCALEETTLLTMLILIHQYCKGKTIEYLNYNNVERLIITALLVAHKNIQDLQFDNIDFVDVTHLKIKELNTLEKKFLAGIEYKFTASPKDLLEQFTFFKSCPKVNSSQYDDLESLFNDLLTKPTDAIDKILASYFQLLPEETAELKSYEHRLRHGMLVTKCLDHDILNAKLKKIHKKITQELTAAVYKDCVEEFSQIPTPPITAPSSPSRSRKN